MRIDQLRIKNFKGFAEETYQFSAPFNLLIGKNGTGKTSILEALSVAAGTLFIDLDTQDKRTIEDNEIRLVKHQVAPAEFRMERQFPVEIEAKGEVAGNPVEWQRSKKSSGGKTTYKYASELRECSKKIHEQVMNGESVTLPMIGYYGTGRVWLQKQAKPVSAGKVPSRFDGYTDCLDPASNEKLFIAWYKRIALVHYRKSISRQEGPGSFQAVSQAVVEAMPRCEQFFYRAEEDTVFARFKDGRELPLQHFSDGERNMLGMVADIAYRMAILNPHLGEKIIKTTPGVILIDEMDLHLHPEWQRQVVESLVKTFPSIQFIATTHSPFIIQSLEPNRDRIISLSPVEGFPPRNVDTMGVEEVAEHWQNVSHVQRSARYREKIDTAEAYFRLLEEAKQAPKSERGDYLEKLDSLMDEMEAEGHDPAYQAAMRLERAAAGFGRTS
ncbi:AAA family ATPase [Sulfidibacter corallicola]|uniref:AAA family ATPase n=1 Tax=Sulfidibacter corallicola TaxID=2818388 RepID=A0A8A4THB8_SULCO|nr:AAA family ATPase [Sulfidibacter corallicola]QTD49326.1 AAA family ATPase [Sulfidibacter corallicola]